MACALLCADLLPWEKRYFRDFLPTLESRGVLTHIEDVLQEGGPPLLDRDAVVWVIARDWRRAVKGLPSNHRGKVYVSLLQCVPAERVLGFFPGSWNPTHLDIHLLAHSPFTYRFYSEMERAPLRSLSMAPLPGLNLAKSRPVSPGSTLRVGVQAALSGDANLSFLTSVAHALSTQAAPVRLVVSSEGPLVAHLKAMIGELGLQAYFEFGSLGETDDMDALCFAPLRSDQFLPVLWAGARALPVVASQVPGIEDFLVHDRGGFLVPVNGTAAMAEQLIRLGSDSSLRKRWGDGLQEGLMGKFPLERVVDHYQRFLGRTPAPSRGVAA